jgi:hypothetical protein
MAMPGWKPAHDRRLGGRRRDDGSASVGVGHDDRPPSEQTVERILGIKALAVETLRALDRATETITAASLD